MSWRGCPTFGVQFKLSDDLWASLKLFRHANCFLAEEFRANSLPLNFQGNGGIARFAVKIAAGVGVIAFIGQVADVDRQCGVFVDFIARHDVPYRVGRLPQSFGFVGNV